jgi:alkaline phosphatase D
LLSEPENRENMNAKIAFGSCCRASKYPNQPVWSHIAAQSPDHLVLLGDQIYMDFGLPLFGGNLYEPQGMSFREFVDTMYEKYREQYSVPEFRSLLSSLPNLHIQCIWDDHDFAWNNSIGGVADEKHHVPRNKRLASRQLFEQFRTTIRERPSKYPQVPIWPANSCDIADLAGVYSSSIVAGVRVIALDLRTWGDLPDTDAELLGPDQEAWLRNELEQSEKEVILCSSLTLSKGTSWDDYPSAYERLLSMIAATKKKVLVLSGDIHVNKIKSHENPFGGYPIYEATSSGLAMYGYKLSYSGDLSNSGMITIDDDVIAVRLFRDIDRLDGSLNISRTEWR